MIHTNDIEKAVRDFCIIKKSDVETTFEMDERIINDALQAHKKSQKLQRAGLQPNIRRIIMKSRIIKLAAAAVIIIAVLFGLKFTGGPDMGNNAWGNVIRRAAQVDYMHVYWLKSRGDTLFRQFEAWYAHGKLVMRGDKGGMTYDDGQTKQTFDEQGMRVGKEPSFFAEGKTFLELFTADLLSDKNEQLSRQTPTSVGDDFLIYEVDPPPYWNHSDDLERIVITVGKNSLLPVQMKVFEKDSDDYDLVMFDYEASEKPAEFFVAPTVGAANCGGEVVLDGEEVVLNIEGAPGLKEGVVRLHDKYDGPAEQFPSDYISSEHLSPDFCKAVNEGLRKEYEREGGPIFRLQVLFITDEGYLSGTNEIIVLRPNEGEGRCGVGSASGGLDDWPDGKYRNIRFSPSLKPTDKEDTYIVEIRCRLKSKDD